jgi:hypothetical protein
MFVKEIESSFIMNVHAHYVTDEKGTRISVILPINEYENLLEELIDVAVIAARRNESSVSHYAVIERLKSDGLL